MLRNLLLVTCGFVMAAGCGEETLIETDGSVPGSDAGGMDSSAGGSDASVVSDAGSSDSGLSEGRCGDNELNIGEMCDDGNRDDLDGCNSECQLECGDGIVQDSEVCDTAISEGETGACPSDCDDSDDCTVDVITGVDCLQLCTHAEISAPADDDLCCPPGADASSDNDCASACGNMVLEPGELCEDGSGTECSLPCDDMNSCTDNVVTGDASTCDRECTFAPITMCVLGSSDGCCPAGCNSTDDADCSASCGNGIFEPPAELCENGTGTPCPSACDDGDACTTDTLVGSAATCNAECSTTPVTACAAASDGCCPPSCNATNDSDCAPVCGNGVVEPPEECDDGNTSSMDGCTATCTTEVVPPTTFRLNDLDLRDPHGIVSIFGCRDLTDMSFAGISVNGLLQDSIQDDTDPADGDLDLSIAVVFRPLAQTAPSSPLSVALPDCSAPLSSTSCSLPVGGTRVDGMATNMTSGTCLGIIPGTVRPYSPAVAPVVAAPGQPCFVSDEQTLTVTISGAPLTLQLARIAATYTGSPASSLSNGLVRGFLTEAEAESTMIDLPILGMRTVASLLAGGMGNCSTRDDRDMADIGGTATSGWWFYLYFDTAVEVPYTEL